MTQGGFVFDAALTADPISQIAQSAPRGDASGLVARLRAVLPSLPDDVDLDAPLLAIGLHAHSLTGWHRARSMDALLAVDPYLDWQVYRADGGQLRYRRLLPMLPCPGYEDQACNVLTRGGRRCQAHLLMEEEDLFNFA